MADIERGKAERKAKLDTIVDMHNAGNEVRAVNGVFRDSTRRAILAVGGLAVGQDIGEVEHAKR